jgi:hypothetical protein
MNEFYAGWGTLALINSALARCMTRSGLAWFVLSLFLGPIATAALAVLGPPDSRKRRTKSAA